MDLKLRKLAERLCIGCGSVARIWKRSTNTEDVMKQSSSKSRAHCRALDDYHEFFILGLVFQSPTTYLRHSIEQATNAEVSIPTICRLLRRYGLTRKKIQRVALQRSSILRAAFIANMFLYKRNALVWLDETGSDK